MGLWGLKRSKLRMTGITLFISAGYKQGWLDPI